MSAPRASAATPALPLTPHEGAGMGRRLLRWLPGDLGPRREHINLGTLRARSRDLYRNNALARAALDRLVADWIGTGVAPRPLVERNTLRLKLVTAWESWGAACDFDGGTDIYGLQAMAAQAMFQAGEVFVRLLPDDAAAIPLSIQLIESDQVPLESRDLPNGRRIIDGIEFDARGRRTAVWVAPRHPADGGWVGSNDTVRVPADQILHLFEAHRPGQIRGVPLLSPVLARLKALDDFDDAQLERQRVANLFAGFVTNPPAADLRQPLRTSPGMPAVEPPPAAAPEDLTLSFEPGTLQELLPGQDIEFTEPPGTSAGYLDFTRRQAMEVCAALGVPYALVTGDYSQANDRVMRVAINEYRRRCQQLTYTTLVPRLLRPLRTAWIEAAQLAGRLPTRSDLSPTRWTMHAWPYIHPLQDVQADALRIEKMLASRSEVLLERGYDAELMDFEIAADRARESELRLRSAGKTAQGARRAAGPASASTD